MLGAEGKQLVCYTNVKTANTPPKAPGGGGFGCEQFSLDSLYADYKLRKNVWTKSNILLDLCRYLFVKVTFYRHPETDFIVAYHRQPPFDISKEIYAACHPQNMLLARHKILILSKFTNPKGRMKKTKRIKPPKQMLNKWFFQEHFSHEPLLMIQASAANLNYSNLGCCNTNQMTTFFYINPGFYQIANWGATTTTGYVPYSTFPTSGVYTWNLKQWQTKTGGQQFTKPQGYNNSVSYDKGFFSKQMLEAVQLTKDQSGQQPLGMNPVNICRYNPTLDSGKGNAIWLVSSHANTYREPITDKTLIFEGLPLYMLLYGYLSYVQKVKNVRDFLNNYTLCMRSPALFPYSQPGAETQIIIPVNENFIHGKAPYDEALTDTMKGYWTPNVYQQIQTLNTMVESGPYVPKYSQQKTAHGNLTCSILFILSGVDPNKQTLQSQIQHCKEPMKYPIHSNKQYKLGTQGKLKQLASYTHGTSGKDTLQHQLLKECQTTSRLIQLSNQIQRSFLPREEEQGRSSRHHGKSKKKSKHVSRNSSKKVPSKRKQRKTSTSSSSSSTSSSRTSSGTSSE